MKRLTDQGSKLAHVTLNAVLDNFGIREEEALTLRALGNDHLQAREDVKRVLLFMESAQEDGAVDWEQWEELRAEVGL